MAARAVWTNPGIGCSGNDRAEGGDGDGDTACSVLLPEFVAIT